MHTHPTNHADRRLGFTIQPPTYFAGQQAATGSNPIMIGNLTPVPNLTQAEFLRLPPRLGRCPLTGASRSTLEAWVRCGLVKSVKIRRPGALRGITFLEKASLLAFLRAQTDTAASNGKEANHVH